MKLARASFAERLAQQHLRQERAQADRRVDDGIRERGRTGVDLGHDDNAQVLRFTRDVGAAFHQHGGLNAAHAQVVGLRHALRDLHVAGNVVERKTFLEHVAKVEQQAAWQ